MWQICSSKNILQQVCMYIPNQTGHFCHPLNYMWGANGYGLNNGKLSTCAEHFEIHNPEP